MRRGGSQTAIPLQDAPTVSMPLQRAAIDFYIEKTVWRGFQLVIHGHPGLGSSLPHCSVAAVQEEVHPSVGSGRQDKVELVAFAGLGPSRRDRCWLPTGSSDTIAAWGKMSLGF